MGESVAQEADLQPGREGWAAVRKASEKRCWGSGLKEGRAFTWGTTGQEEAVQA